MTLVLHFPIGATTTVCYPDLKASKLGSSIENQDIYPMKAVTTLIALCLFEITNAYSQWSTKLNKKDLDSFCLVITIKNDSLTSVTYKNQPVHIHSDSDLDKYIKTIQTFNRVRIITDSNNNQISQKFAKVLVSNDIGLWLFSSDTTKLLPPP